MKLRPRRLTEDGRPTSGLEASTEVMAKAPPPPSPPTKPSTDPKPPPQAAADSGATATPQPWHRPGPWIPGMPDSGCFAGDTEIVLADGSTKPLERLEMWRSATQPGDAVMTLEGRSARIVDLLEGTEPLPLVMLNVMTKDAAGETHRFTLSVTDKHPILVRYHSLVFASWIQTGDEVHTIYGPGIVTDVERTQPGSKVWNVIMSGDTFLNSGIYSNEQLKYAYSVSSLLGLPPLAHTVFANGIATATWPLQTQLAAAVRNGFNLNLFG